MTAKQQKKLYLTMALALIGAGVLCLAFMNKFTSCGFFGFELIGASLILLGKFAKINYNINLIELDKKLKNKIKEYENNNDDSEYNDFIDDEMRKEIIRSFIKKNKKSHIAFYVLSAVFILVGFLSF